MQKQRNTCKICDKRCRGEYCFTHRPRKAIKQKGKQALKWQEVRASWIARYGTNHTCYICHKKLDKTTLTLDHVIPRSNARNYANRHDDSNLKPSCWVCNGLKGSSHLV